MNQEKIGKFICELRKEKKLTQQELADKIGVTDRAISNWENGRRLPDYSIIKDLCKELGITINEFFVGERLSIDTFKTVADNNLLRALENSTFTIKDKVEYYKKKWEKEHFGELILTIIIIVFFIIYGFIKDNSLQYLFMIIGFICGAIENNMKMAYVERNSYGPKSNISIAEFEKYIQRLKEFKLQMKGFKNKAEAIDYLVNETGLSKTECTNAYNLIMKLDLEKFDKAF